MAGSDYIKITGWDLSRTKRTSLRLKVEKAKKLSPQSIFTYSVLMVGKVLFGDNISKPETQRLLIAALCQTLKDIVDDKVWKDILKALEDKNQFVGIFIESGRYDEAR